MIKCKICQKEFRIKRTLSEHIKTHNMTTQQYYDKFILENSKDKFCFICGKEKKFYKFEYQQTCGNIVCVNKIISNKNSKQSSLTKEKRKNTNLKKYGTENVFQSQIIKEKIKKTFLNNLGVDNPMKSEDIRNKATQTKKLLYNDPKYNNFKKAIQTKLNDIDETGKNLIERSINKAKQTKKEKYNDENYNNRDKFKETCLNTFGVNYCLESNIIKEKSKKTCLEKYGKINFAQTTNFKDLFKNKFFVKDIINKIYNTKRKNNSFNISKPEKVFEQLLLNNNIKYIYNYKSELYPFNCDFYLSDLNIYIELNLHWTHGKEPFDNTNLDHIKKLKKWQSKNTKYYNIAIKVWTQTDVFKRQIAKKNNLNYIEIFDEKKFDDIINNLV